ncbi:MAG: PspA/IM30 family protein [Planctomycetaceae bacterium]|nr:PspA/IM30 family protein [Planctomycetaceae bacterium]
MPFFSRLTDIVTCNLTSILAAAEDPEAALREIIHEMEQGVAGAQRSMKTAGDNETRLRAEIDEQRRQGEYWVAQARQNLQADNEEQARLDLLRKHEADNLTAGLEMQLKAATATREHLTTTFHALEARLADARRRLDSLLAGDDVAVSSDSPVHPRAAASSSPRAMDVIDVELAALKRQLKGDG